MSIVESTQPAGESIAIGDINRSRVDLGASGTTGLGDLGQACGVASVQCERDARRGIIERQCLADTARGSGDDDA